MPSPRRICCQVTRLVSHGDHVYTVVMAPETRLPRFRPGQFLHLTVDEYDPGGFWPESRVFSIANSPAERDRLEITYVVKGAYTSRMEHELAEGRHVWVKLPYGEFVVRDRVDTVLLAGGTGMTAFAAFLDGLQETQNRIHVVYGARHESLLVYKDLVVRKITEVPQLDVTILCEQADDGFVGGDLDGRLKFDTGRISVDRAFSGVADPLRAEYYLSGPPAMIDALSNDLRRHGVSQESIRVDEWS